jgi:hypothetical protein
MSIAFNAQEQFPQEFDVSQYLSLNENDINASDCSFTSDALTPENNEKSHEELEEQDDQVEEQFQEQEQEDQDADQEYQQMFQHDVQIQYQEPQVVDQALHLQQQQQQPQDSYEQYQFHYQFQQQPQYTQDQLMEPVFQPQNTQPTICFQPTFTFITAPQVTSIEPQVQPHYFYIPPPQSAPSNQPTPIITETSVHTSVNPLSLSTDNFPSPSSSLTTLPASTSRSMRSSSLPPYSTIPTPIITTTGTRKSKSFTTLSKKGSRPVGRPCKVKEEEEEEDDEEYQEAEEEEFYAPNKVCRLSDCPVCQRDLPDCLKVNQPSWASILRVVFYALKVNYPHKEFFNLRNHVYDFVDVHWNKICVGKTRSEHWKKQLQDTLAHNKKLFVSGAELFKQKGFWRLDEMTDPWQISLSSSTSLLKESKERVRDLAERRQQPKRAARALKKPKLNYSI